MQATSGPIVGAPHVGRSRLDIVLRESGSQVALIGVCGWCCGDVDSESTGNCRFCGSPFDCARRAGMRTGGMSQAIPHDVLPKARPNGKAIQVLKRFIVRAVLGMPGSSAQPRDPRL
jgi:hypothetical protein